jgi:hypothetical protein
MIKKCLNCDNETSNPKFCSSSCSASYNNKLRTYKKNYNNDKICPYCKKFSSNNWNSVRGHVTSCINNNGMYIIDSNEGSIHYTEFFCTFKELNLKYPNLKSTISDIKKSFKKRNIVINTSYQNYTKEEIINYINLFYEKENRIPISVDWANNFPYPTAQYVKKIFKTWNNAIEAAGFIPNYNDGFGIRSKAKDGILYRSNYEVYFVNNFLYEKEIYEYETKYPEPYNKYYDFYLPKRNLYIEIDGGLRPHVIEEKIEINKKLNRKLLVIPTKNIASFSF